MAGVKDSKLVLLYISKILLEETDELHPMTPQQLIKRLADFGYECERKTVYRHIEALIEYGLDILRSDCNPRGYYVVSRDFDLTELRLLVDAVQSSQFISHKKSAELIEKLSSLASSFEAEQIKKGLHMRGVTKTDNERLYYTIDAIYKAIATNKRIEFKYFEYTPTKEKRYRNDGKKYLVSPYAVVRDDERYYLHAYHEKYETVSTFRIDLIDDAKVSELNRLKTDEYAGYDPSERTKSAFDQFGGDKMTVVAEFDNSLAGSVISRFGLGVNMQPVGEDRFRATFEVEMSPRFFSWLFGFEDKVKLISPKSAIEGYRDLLAKVDSLYS